MTTRRKGGLIKQEGNGPVARACGNDLYCMKNGLGGCLWPQRSLLTSILSSVASITYVPVLLWPLIAVFNKCSQEEKEEEETEDDKIDL